MKYNLKYNQIVIFILLAINSTFIFADYASDFEQSYQQNRRAAEEARRQQEIYYNVILPQQQQSGSGSTYNPHIDRPELTNKAPPILFNTNDTPDLKGECVIENTVKVCYRYYDDAHKQLKSIIPYKNGNVMHGVVKRYQKNGKLSSLQYWKDGEAVGKWQIYDRQGNLKEIDEFVNNVEVRRQSIVNGMPHGKEIFFRYDSNGTQQIDHVVEWENGKRVN